MLPSWVDPHISLDGIAAIITVLVAGGGALKKVLMRFTSIENQSKANAATLVEHGVKIDRIGDMSGRMTLLEQIQLLQGKRLDELISIAIRNGVKGDVQ